MICMYLSGYSWEVKGNDSLSFFSLRTTVLLEFCNKNGSQQNMQPRRKHKQNLTIARYKQCPIIYAKCLKYIL